MADILLTVGVDSSLSYSEFQSGISALVSKINSKPIEIKVKPQIDQSAIAELKKQISAVSSAASKTNVQTSSGSSYMQSIANGAKAANSQISATTSHLNAVKAALKEIGTTNSSITSAYKKLSASFGGNTATGQNAADLSAMKAKYLELQNAVENLNSTKATATQEDINNVYRLQTEMQQLINTTNQRVEAEKAAAAAAEQAAKDEAAAVKQAAKAKEDAAKQAAKAEQDAIKTTAAKEQAEKKYHDTLSRLQNTLKNYSAAENSSNASSQTAYAAIKKNTDELQAAFTAYKSGTMSLDDFKAKLASANTELSKNAAIIKQNGDATQTLGQRVGGLASKFASWLTVSQLIMYAVNSMRKMISTSIELDTAMTELKKVTDESDASYSQFLENAETRAKTIGSSLTDIVNATADFARLGYNIDEASELADVATIYNNVGDDVESISDASDSIIATMQAFGISADDAMSIVDKFNEVGNNFAISSGGIGEALLRSAAAMNAAGNTLDETIALTTAANTVVQNPETVGEFAPNNTVMY